MTRRRGRRHSALRMLDRLIGKPVTRHGGNYRRSGLLTLRQREKLVPKLFTRARHKRR